MPNVAVGSAVLVTGDTKDVRDDLKKIGEGVWVQSMSGWLFPESKRAAVEAALAGKATIVPASSIASASAPVPSVAAGATLSVRPHKKAILVTGETMKVKDQLKSLHGSWNKTLQGWIFKGSDREKVLELLRQDATNSVSEDSAAAPPSKKAKRDFVVGDDEESFDDDGDSD